MNTLDPLAWPGRTLLRTANTPDHVDDDVRNTWTDQPTLPLEPHHYTTDTEGDLVLVRWKQTGELVYQHAAPLILVPCPVPF